METMIYSAGGNEGREVFWNAKAFQFPLDILALIGIAIMGVWPL